MIFEEVKITFEEVKPTCDCGKEVECTFGDENPTVKEFGLTLL